jgi:hypothetical protein
MNHLPVGHRIHRIASIGSTGSPPQDPGTYIWNTDGTYRADARSYRICTIARPGSDPRQATGVRHHRGRVVRGLVGGVRGVCISLSRSLVDRVAATHPMSGDRPTWTSDDRTHPDMPRTTGPLGVQCMGVHACMGVHHARAVPDRYVTDPVRPMVRCTTTAKPAPGAVPSPGTGTGEHVPPPGTGSAGAVPPPAGAVPPPPRPPVQDPPVQPPPDAVPRVQPARYRNRGTCYWACNPAPPACKPAGRGTRR